MNKWKNRENKISVRNAIDDIFLQIEDFLKNREILDTKEDIVFFFNVLIDYSNQIMEKYYDSVTQKIAKDFDPVLTDEEGHIIKKEWKYYEAINFLLHDLYEGQEENLERQINTHTSDKDNPLSEKNIYITYKGNAWILENMIRKGDFDQVMHEFQASINKKKNSLLRILEKAKRESETQKNKQQQKSIAMESARAIKNILWDSASPLTIQETNFATEEDFLGWYHTIQNIIHEIYAEKEEYFNNFFLGFDLQTWTFQSWTEKEKQYKKHFYGKRWAKRLQETKGIDSNKTLPALLLGTSLEIMNVIKNNTQSLLQTDEQKIDKYINERAGYLEDSTKEAAKKTIFERCKKHNPKTDEEKTKIMEKTVSTYYDIERHRKTKFRIEITNNEDINRHIADNIRSCYSIVDFEKLSKYDSDKIVNTLSEKQKIAIIKIEESSEQRKRCLWEEIFGEWFDFEVLKEGKRFKEDLRFYTKAVVLELEHAYMAILNELFPWNKRIKEFFEKAKILEKEKDKGIQEAIMTYLFLQDIEKIKEIEKEIQERFDTTFILDTEKLWSILYALMKQIVNDRISISHDRARTEKRMIEITKRMSLYGIINKQGNSFIIDAYEKIGSKLEEMCQLEMFLKIVKQLSIPLHYNKEKIQEILQKEYDSLQYNVNDFWVYHINKLEKIKTMALEFGVELNLPTKSPLETYYIHRLRTPERILTKQMKENFLDRESGTSGYEKDNLASIYNLEALAQDIGMPLKREEALNIDMRNYKNIPIEQRFNVEATVPIAINMPKVHVTLTGNWDEKWSMQWHYIFSYDPQRKLYALLFDDSFMSAELLMEKYKFTDQLILGGWFLSFDTTTGSLLVEDRIDEYNHEPRILSITALKNAIKDALPGYRVFIGNDGVDKLEDYF